VLDKRILYYSRSTKGFVTIYSCSTKGFFTICFRPRDSLLRIRLRLTCVRPFFAAPAHSSVPSQGGKVALSWLALDSIFPAKVEAIAVNSVGSRYESLSLWVYLYRSSFEARYRFRKNCIL